MVSKVKEFVRAERTSLAMQGMATILFGIAAVFWPGITVEALVYLIAVFLVVYGVVALGMGFVNIGRNGKRAALMLLGGLIEIVIGVYFFQESGIAFETIVLVLGLVLVVRGVFALMHIVGPQKRSASARTMQAVVGAVTAFVGLTLLIYPIGSTIALVWVLGIYALITGPMLLAMSSDVAKLAARK